MLWTGFAQGTTFIQAQVRIILLQLYFRDEDKFRDPCTRHRAFSHYHTVHTVLKISSSVVVPVILIMSLR